MREVSYVGQSTRYEVDLDRGGELIVIQQNFETSHDEARDMRGQKIRVGWRPEQTYTLDASTNEPPEEEA